MSGVELFNLIRDLKFEEEKCWGECTPLFQMPPPIISGRSDLPNVSILQLSFVAQRIDQEPII